MFHNWTPELIKSALIAITPTQLEMIHFDITYKRNPSIETIKKKNWNIRTIEQYRTELEAALSAARDHFASMGINSMNDLDILQPARTFEGRLSMNPSTKTMTAANSK
jgi:hypothetical protein